MRDLAEYALGREMITHYKEHVANPDATAEPPVDMRKWRYHPPCDAMVSSGRTPMLRPRALEVAGWLLRQEHTRFGMQGRPGSGLAQVRTEGIYPLQLPDSEDTETPYAMLVLRGQALPRPLPDFATSQVQRLLTMRDPVHAHLRLMHQRRPVGLTSYLGSMWLDSMGKGEGVYSNVPGEGEAMLAQRRKLTTLVLESAMTEIQLERNIFRSDDHNPLDDPGH